jgi:hypothetical protein
MIDQDEKDTFTAHHPLGEDTKGTIDPYEIIYKTVSGCKGRWAISVDEIITHSEWQPSFSVAEKYSIDSCRVLLAGDAGESSIYSWFISRKKKFPWVIELTPRL